MGSIVQQLQGLPQLTSTDPLCWLGLEPWTPKWTPHCSWAQPPQCLALPQAPTSSASTPVKTQQGSAASGDVAAAAAVPVHAVHPEHAEHAGQTPQQGGVKEPGLGGTPAASGRGETACHDFGETQAPDYHQLACSIEEQHGEKDIQKVL